MKRLARWLMWLLLVAAAAGCTGGDGEKGAIDNKDKPKAAGAEKPADKK